MRMYAVAGVVAVVAVVLVLVVDYAEMLLLPVVMYSTYYLGLGSVSLE
jgi:hypothetical protein